MKQPAKSALKKINETVFLFFISNLNLDWCTSEVINLPLFGKSRQWNETWLETVINTQWNTAFNHSTKTTRQLFDIWFISRYKHCSSSWFASKNLDTLSWCRKEVETVNQGHVSRSKAHILFYSSHIHNHSSFVWWKNIKIRSLWGLKTVKHRINFPSSVCFELFWVSAGSFWSDLKSRWGLRSLTSWEELLGSQLWCCLLMNEVITWADMANVNKGKRKSLKLLGGRMPTSFMLLSAFVGYIICNSTHKIIKKTHIEGL